MQDILDIQKQKRDQLVNKRRNLENYDDTNTNFIKVDGRKKQTTTSTRPEYKLAISMMNSKWMLETPEEIDDWISVLCPEGKRCCVIIQNSITRSLNKFGKTLKIFPSLFPSGCNLSNNCSSHFKRTVLDCIYSYKLKKYYILDIIEWMNVPYRDFEAEFRFFFIQNKLVELPGINEVSTMNFYPFELAPRMSTRFLYTFLLERSTFFPENVDLDGINFYHPQGLYTPGETPLVLWIKPFMVPDVLQKPVNDQLAHFQRPPDYVNIFKYSESFKKIQSTKYETVMKNFSSDCNKIEVDDTLKTDKDPVIDNEMCMENEI